MPIYCYNCPVCNNYYEELYGCEDYPQEIPCTCGEYAKIFISSAPALKTDNFEGDFDPYYDGQLGQHFQSKSQKDKWLKDNDLEQVSGPSSPQEDKPGNFKCTESQGKKA